MKRMLLTFSALMLGAGATMADGTDYLTLRQADGSEISVPSAGLKITFNNGQLVAQSAGQADLTLPVAALQAMFFSATPTSIATPLKASDITEIYSIDGRLFNAPGSQVQIVKTADGKIIKTIKR
ncbi:MAG: hypothetical protein SOU82_02785 [Alloprevotella sp.]|nr:hypothetical protein [Alloprevotella sp.]MDY4568295.1 hypothetical protein [Alloprevotella sp.]